MQWLVLVGVVRPLLSVLGSSDHLDGTPMQRIGESGVPATHGAAGLVDPPRLQSLGPCGELVREFAVAPWQCCRLLLRGDVTAMVVAVAYLGLLLCAEACMFARPSYLQVNVLVALGNVLVSIWLGLSLFGRSTDARCYRRCIELAILATIIGLLIAVARMPKTKLALVPRSHTHVQSPPPDFPLTPRKFF